MTERLAIRSELVDFTDNPFAQGENAVRHFKDGILLIDKGHVTAVDDAKALLQEAERHYKLLEYPHHIVTPGFIDTHVHYPQTEMIASYGEQLLTWLEKYTFPTEAKFKSPTYSREIAEIFLKELLKNGTTTAVVFGTVHPQSVDALFRQAHAKNLRLIAGKVMMDKHCPDELMEQAVDSYHDSKALIEKWHGKGRLSYAVTPRFAPTSSPALLENAKLLLDEYDDLYFHTHLAENKAECEWVKRLFPNHIDYLSVYEQAGLINERAVFAHGIHLSPREWSCLHAHSATISHCPTSNLFIGSGLFKLQTALQENVHVALGTDVGAGTSFSLLQTYNEAYKVQQLQGQTLSAYQGLYLMTLGAARALKVDDKIGHFNTGCEADFVVWDKTATPLIKLRTQHSESLHDTLFAMMMLGDDRVIAQTYVMGKAIA